MTELESLSDVRKVIRFDALTRPLFVMALCLLHFLNDWVAIPIVYRLKLGELASGLVVFGLFGILIGQIHLLAAYQSWGRGSVWYRIPASCMLACLVWYAFTAGALSTRDSFEIGSIPEFAALIVGSSFLAACVFEWSLKPLGWFQIELKNPDPTAAGSRQRLMWTRDAVAMFLLLLLVTAVFTTTFHRDFWRSAGSVSWSNQMMFQLWVTLWTIAGLAVAIPAHCACLTRGRLPVRLVIYFAYALGLTIIEAIVMTIVARDGRQYWWLAGWNLGVMTQVVSVSLLLRICGYRLDQRKTTPPNSFAEPSERASRLEPEGVS